MSVIKVQWKDQKYKVVEISDNQLIMMSNEEFDDMVESNAQEGLQGYILKFEGTSIECSTWLFQQGFNTPKPSPVAYLLIQKEEVIKCIEERFNGCTEEEKELMFSYNDLPEEFDWEVREDQNYDIGRLNLINELLKKYGL